MTEHMPPPPAGSPPSWRASVALVRPAVIVAVLMLLVIGAAGTLLWSKRPRLAPERIRDVVHSTIQRETPASFLVTGYIDVTTTTRVENSRTLLPGIVGIDLGTTTATVRIPGRISYGFDVRTLTPAMIHVFEDGTVEVEVPDPEIFALEPNLAQLEVETQRGWLRLSERTTEAVRGRALELVQATMRAQGEAHLADAVQPRINTADALYDMLRPALVAAGVTDPQIRFRVSRVLVVEPARRELPRRPSQ
jgi:hypothetical protein